MNNSIQLPSFLSNLEVVGTFSDAMDLCRVPSDIVVNDSDVTITQRDTPIAILPPSLVDAYLKNDQDTINSVQKQNYDNLELIRQDFKNVGNDAWSYVKDKETGEHFFIAYNDNAVTWVCPAAMEQQETKQLVMSIGSLDRVTSQASHGSIVFSNEKVQEYKDAFVALAAAAVAELFTGGLTIAASALSSIFVTCAAAVGLGMFAFIIPVIAVAAVAAVMVVGLAIGCVLLVDWLISLLAPDFFIKCLIFNFDDTRDWSSGDYFFDNAKVAGKDQKYKDFCIPKKQKADPPSWLPVDPESVTVYYVELDLENDSKFMEGLGFALSMKSDGAGFTLASDCPYTSATVIKETAPAASDVKSYFKDGDWVDGLTQNIDVNGMPVGMTLNKHHGAENNLYQVTVLIGKSV